VAPPTAGRDPRREACDAQARRLATPEGRVELVALAAAADRDAPAERAADAVAREIVARYQDDTPAPIGIWRPEEHGDELVFVRDEAAPTRDWWPPHATLAPKRSLLPLRVVLIGESTAAGWFYAPAVTPARVLARQLERARGPAIFEVVDLTAVNQQPGGLLELAGAVLQLGPDILVVFAGNNWPHRLPWFPGASQADCTAAAAALREGGMPALRGWADARTRHEAEFVLAVLAEVAEAGGVALAVVVPEVNAAAWPRDRPVPWLPADGAGRWHDAHVTALGALEARAWPRALEAARAMLTLDGGVSPTSHRLLGEALAGLGRHNESRAAHLAAVDARAWDNFPAIPSATETVREAIRAGAAVHDYVCVDLPAALAAASSGPLFLDYCHLSLEGMRVAMAAVAETVLRLAGPGRPPAVIAEAPAVSPEHDATAKLMTALYTAHWTEPPDVGAGPRTTRARDWLAAALDAWPGIEDAARAYVATRAVPASAAGLSAADHRFGSTLSALEQEMTHDDGLDPGAVSDIAAALAARGRPLAPEVDDRLVRHHGVAGGVDLARGRYHWRLLDRYEGSAGFAQQACAFYRARWPVSHFCLVADGAVSVRLALTARLPRVDTERAAEITIEVNDTAVGRAALTHRWTCSTLDVPAARLRRGFNRVSLRWPALPPDGDAALARICERLDLGVPVDLHPVFGEVFSLLATAAAR
jgi:hypothetical protein